MSHTPGFFSDIDLSAPASGAGNADGKDAAHESRIRVGADMPPETCCGVLF